MQQASSSARLAARWQARLAFVAVGSVLQSLAFEPFGQAWLAWIAWVPLLFVLGGTNSLRAAFAWGWLAGVLFFAINLWWLWVASIPGMIALMLHLGLHWAVFAVVIRGAGLPAFNGDGPPASSPGRRELEFGMRASRSWTYYWWLPAAALLIPAVWVAVEWLRAYGAPGFSWVFAGHSQSSLPIICQIADFAGVFGISFCIMLVNVLALAAIIHFRNRRHVLMCAAAAAVVVLMMAGYGAFRLSEDTTYPGPQVMVVQPNHPHLRGGARTVSREDAVAFHVIATSKALQDQSPDLIAWPEAVVPPLNAEARDELQSSPAGGVIHKTHQLLGQLTARAGASLVTGGNHVSGWIQEGSARVGTEIRNSVYFYGPDGQQSAACYDKCQLVPFAERVAFRDSAPWLHRAFLWLSPPVASQQLVAGDRRACTVFTLETGHRTTESAAADEATTPSHSGPGLRFVTPICLENIDSGLIAEFLRDSQGNGKRADFLVNVSNDGWFSAVERAQHFQNIIFRSIENRVPAARASNTGISGFVDSVGRVVQAIPAGAEATATSRLMLDRRVSFYTRHGDLFAEACAIIASMLVLIRIPPAIRRRLKRGHPGGLNLE